MVSADAAAAALEGAQPVIIQGLVTGSATEWLGNALRSNASVRVDLSPHAAQPLKTGNVLIRPAEAQMPLQSVLALMKAKRDYHVTAARFEPGAAIVGRC